MSKVINSPVDNWPGSVTIADPMTIPQAIAFEDALEITNEMIAGKKVKVGNPKYNLELLRGLCPSVEKWELQGLADVTPETFPASPKNKSIELLSWLVEEIGSVYSGATQVPNA